jgi:hypothetical protein
MTRRHGLGLVIIMLGAGCGWNYTPSDNTLPAPTAQSESDGEGETSGSEGDPPGSEGDPPPATGETEEPEQDDLPASYRVECMDIQSLGDADDTVFQVAILQDVWTNDIANFKLNVIFDVLSLDEAAGTGTVTIRSGVGSGWNDQCAYAQTGSAEFPINYEPMVTTWAPSDAADTCATPVETGGSGTFALELGADDRFYIYAQDDDGTAFNCSLEAGAPDAIPILAVSATISSTADGSALAGRLTGCMAEADTREICSCLSVCSGNQHPKCPGCPGGALPLGDLLGTIFTTQRCTELLGEPAFDAVIDFSARRLPNVPETCS